MTMLATDRQDVIRELRVSYFGGEQRVGVKPRESIRPRTR